MAEQDKYGELDDLLDSLLAAYSDAEPRPGMETRLLANLRTDRLPSRRTSGWKWLVAGAGAVALAVILFAIYLSRIPALPELPRIQVAGPPVLTPTPAASRSGHQSAMRPAARKGDSTMVTVAGVRPEVFPTPSPLSEQERLLFRYLAETPSEEVATHSHSDEPAEPSVPLGPQSQQLNETEVQGVR